MYCDEKSGRTFQKWAAATGKNSQPVSHNVSPRRPALTTKTTAGIDMTGHPSLAVDCQQDRPTHCRSGTCNVTSAQSLNSLHSGTCIQWSSFSSDIKGSYRSVNHASCSAALKVNWIWLSWYASNPARTELQLSSCVRTRHYQSDERLLGDWTRDAVKLSQYSKTTWEDLGDMHWHWQTVVNWDLGHACIISWICHDLSQWE